MTQQWGSWVKIQARLVMRSSFELPSNMNASVLGWPNQSKDSADPNMNAHPQAAALESPISLKKHDVRSLF